ncbi:MAG: hypothetical protein JXP73_19945 [Deltaproteobacteria bacterium]|nr:hypothetical protein [Deltaproteobacteria bacterium]
MLPRPAAENGRVPALGSAAHSGSTVVQRFRSANRTPIPDTPKPDN